MQGFLKLAELQAAHAVAAAATRTELAAAAAHAPLPTLSTLPHAATGLATATIAAASCCLARCFLLRDALPQAIAAGNAAASDDQDGLWRTSSGKSIDSDAYAEEIKSAASRAIQTLRARSDEFAAGLPLLLHLTVCFAKRWWQFGRGQQHVV